MGSMVHYWAGLLLAASELLPGAELRKADSAAFDRYTAEVEQALPRRAFTPERMARLRAGETSVVAETRPDPREVGNSLIHDWSGAVFIPGASLARVLRVLQDFDNHKQIYSPEVLDSRLIERKGEEYRSYLRLRKKKVITVILNTEYSTRFFQPSEKRAYSIVHSTRIAEVDNPGGAGEKEKPPGTGYGFLWRLNSYWNLEAGDGGVYVECRAVSLTRDIPTGLGWAIRPMVTSLPRESLEATLSSTRRAVGLVQ